MFKRTPYEAQLVEVDDLNPYLNPNWEVLAEVAKVNEIATGLEIHDLHLWKQPERVQAYCALTWVAASRQMIGESLILTGSKLLDKPGETRRDVKEEAITQFAAAHEALRIRDDVSGTLNYSYDSALRTRVDWPDPSQKHVTKLLMHAMRGTADNLLYVLLPNIAPLWSKEAAHTPAEFRKYRVALIEKFAQIDKNYKGLSRYWHADIAPDNKLSQDVFNGLAELIEDTVSFGTEVLMPVIADSSYRIKTPDVMGRSTYDTLHRQLSGFATQAGLEAYNPSKRVVEPTVSEPKLPKYKPAARLLSEYAPEPVQQTAPATPTQPPRPSRLQGYDPNQKIDEVVEAPRPAPRLKEYKPTSEPDIAPVLPRKAAPRLAEYTPTVDIVYTTPERLDEYDPNAF